MMWSSSSLIRTHQPQQLLIPIHRFLYLILLLLLPLCCECFIRQLPQYYYYYTQSKLAFYPISKRYYNDPNPNIFRPTSFIQFHNRYSNKKQQRQQQQQYTSKTALSSIRRDDAIDDNNDKSTTRLEQDKKKTIRKVDGTISSSSNNNNRNRNTRSSTKKKGTTTNIQPTQQQQTWRVFGVEVHPDRLVEYENKSTNKRNIPKSKSLDEIYINEAVLEALFTRLKVNNEIDRSTIPLSNIRIVRRSVDARPNKFRTDGGYGPRYVYVIDIDINRKKLSTKTTNVWKNQPGRMELLSSDDDVPESNNNSSSYQSTDDDGTNEKKRRVIIVGAGPAGLFCALQLAESGLGIQPIIIERGQPVEIRGKDIGALIHRIQLNNESNFAFGEGGAGTWSDGKLTTRIGRNSDTVRSVLQTFVQFGAPSSILIDGAPHLGTDNLVRLLRNMRYHLRDQGGEIYFGTKVSKLIIEDGITKGVEYIRTRDVDPNDKNNRQRKLYKESSKGTDSAIDEESTTGTVFGDAVVLATGHSARDVYEQLYYAGIQLEPKGFAVGFRIEHPQKLINKIQYGTEWAPTVRTGKETTDTVNREYIVSLLSKNTESDHNNNNGDENSNHPQLNQHDGKLPVPSYRLATDQAYDGEHNRGVYSFCMCPGGQIVPASTDPNEVCVNGMSFSRRDSIWANSALVVTISPDDPILQPYKDQYGVLAGVAFQRDMERRAAIMGGGNLTVPVQRVTDFINGRASTTTSSTSYRLGVQPAACHEIYPPPLVHAIRHALTEYFEKQMPGYVCDDAILHAVETRTSSPLRIPRDPITYQAIGTQQLFPAGEGAGFAGGIVSAAVDGMIVSDAVLSSLFGTVDDNEDIAQKQQKKKNASVSSFY